MKRLLPIFLIPFIFSCISRKAEPSELVLFPKPGENKLWLINTISDEMHFCTLISFEPSGGKEYLTSFTSVWSRKDSASYSGIRTTDKAIVDQKTEFPLFLDLLKADSVANEWNWFMTGNKMKWNGELSGEVFNLKANYKTQSLFQVSQVIYEPQVWKITPVESKLKTKGKLNTKSKGTFCMTVFKNEKEPVKLAQSGSLIWMDLVLDDGCLFNVLFRVNQNTTTLLGYTLRDSAQHYVSTRRLTIDADKKYWKSTESGKSYPLNFTIQLPNYNQTIIIKPLLENQEINAKKSSFWMGAIEAISPEKKTRKGRGNMYIFNETGA